MANYPLTYDKTTAETSKKYPYLRFDAFSMKDLINAKLSENEKLTDYIYPDSNLSILIDIFSEMFSCMMYNLNAAAAESMMSDTTLYKNINRLVKFLGYSPAGFKAATVDVTASVYSKDLSFLIVPKYSTITLNKTDNRGQNIMYSTTDYVYIAKDELTTIPLTNGQWKKYGQHFTAQGEPYETFTLNNLQLEGEDAEYVAYPYFDVYVKRNMGNGVYKTIYFKAVVDTLFSNSLTNEIYGPTDNVFSLRLNESKKYEISFGDGIHGSKLQHGDVITVVYLSSNGKDGEINSQDIENKQFKVNINGLSRSDSSGTSTLTLGDILELNSNVNNTIHANDTIIGAYVDQNESSYDSSVKTFFYGCSNIKKSSSVITMESVDDIKKNAPNWFKRAGRLVTANDYVSYIKSNYYSDIVDVTVMDNYQYMATFYKWLWQLGNEKLGNPKKWINPSLTSLGTYGYKYADASDTNNFYIWIKQNTESTTVGQLILDGMKDIKPLISQPVVVSAVDVRIALCAGYAEEYNADGTIKTLRDFYNMNFGTKKPFVFDDRGQNRLEVEVSSSLNVSTAVVKNRILSVFKNFFSSDYMNIGDTISIGELEKQIGNISGVIRIRTIFRRKLKDGTYSNTDVIIKNGISLAHWNESIVDGYDLEVSNSNIHLQPFQYPEYSDFTKLLDSIDVISGGTSKLSISDS